MIAIFSNLFFVKITHGTLFTNSNYCIIISIYCFENGNNIYFTKKGGFTIPNKKKFYELERLMRNANTDVKSFAQLAKRLNVTRAVISKIYTLNRRLDVLLAFEICKLFNCSLDDLITERYANLLKKGLIFETRTARDVAKSGKGGKKTKQNSTKDTKNVFRF